ncbi:MAG: hypothetical protein R6W06_13215 [Prochlorococcaceae cyanobacterium]
MSATPPVPRRPFPALGRRGLLLVGLSFGLVYGLTQRFLSLDLGDWRPLSHPFDVKPNPGTSLEKLRLRYGAAKRPIAADLELLEQEQADRKQEEQRKRQQAEQDQQLRQEEKRLQQAQELPAAPPPAAPLPLAEPAAPVLPEPSLPELPVAPPEPPASQP